MLSTAAVAFVSRAIPSPPTRAVRRTRLRGAGLFGEGADVADVGGHLVEGVAGRVQPAVHEASLRRAEGPRPSEHGRRRTQPGRHRSGRSRLRYGPRCTPSHGPVSSGPRGLREPEHAWVPRRGRTLIACAPSLPGAFRSRPCGRDRRASCVRCLGDGVRQPAAVALPVSAPVLRPGRHRLPCGGRTASPCVCVVSGRYLRTRRGRPAAFGYTCVRPSRAHAAGRHPGSLGGRRHRTSPQTAPRRGRALSHACDSPRTPS